MTKKTKRATTRDSNARIDKNIPDALASNRPTGFNPDYQYVIKDIRRVGILASSLLVVLVALSLILHL